MTTERYIVLVDGTWSGEAMLPLREALATALQHVDGMRAVEVLIADARTYAVRSRWFRRGMHWQQRADAAWVSAQDPSPIPSVAVA